jgi:hypothetical protein
MDDGDSVAARPARWPFALVVLIAAGLGAWAWMIRGDGGGAGLEIPVGAGNPAGDRIAEARALLSSGQADAARTLLGAIDDPDGEALWLLSRAELQLGNTDEAASALADAEAMGFVDDPMRVEPSPFAGAGRCAECHSEIVRDQQSSNHALTLRDGPAIESIILPEEPVVDPRNPGVSHRIRLEDGGPVVETEAPGAQFRAVIDRLIGSGHHAMTPVVTDSEGKPRELRLSHYAGGVGWDLTTGHPEIPGSPDGFLGRPLGEDEQRRCLNCHATNARDLLEGSGPTLADRGIGCERCHGPGEHHILAVDQGFPGLAIARPKRATAGQVVTLCGDCHAPIDSSPSMSMMASPGPSMTSSEEPTFVRFQAATLVRSACYTRSPASAKFDCVTCHDPHRNAEADPGSYEAICLSCHTGPAGPAGGPSARLAIDPASQIPCPVEPRQGCVACHMPPRPSSMAHTPFTDHHIRVQQDMPMGQNDGATRDGPSGR